MQPLMPPINTPDNLFHDGNPTTGVEGTIVPAEHLNNEQGSIRDVQSEMIAILTAAAMAPDSTAGQLLAALNKLYAPGNDTLGALASLVGAANKLPYFTGPKNAALTDLTAFARTLLGRSDAAGVLSDLGLGTAAEIDVATNAEVITGTANKAVTAASLKNRFNTVVLYPNGTESAPPTLTANQRIVIDNPFPGRPVVAQVEVFANGIWAEPYFMAAPYGNSGPAAGATPSYLYETDKIVIQTGNDGVLYRSSISGSAHNLSGGGDAFGGSIFTSKPYRLRVRAI